MRSDFSGRQVKTSLMMEPTRGHKFLLNWISIGTDLCYSCIIWIRPFLTLIIPGTKTPRVECSDRSNNKAADPFQLAKYLTIPLIIPPSNRKWCIAKVELCEDDHVTPQNFPMKSIRGAILWRRKAGLGHRVAEFHDQIKITEIEFLRCRYIAR